MFPNGFLPLGSAMSVIPINSTATPAPTGKGPFTGKITSVLPNTPLSSEGSTVEVTKTATRPLPKLGNNLTLMNGSANFASLMVTPVTTTPVTSKALIVPHITIAPTGPLLSSPSTVTANKIEAVSSGHPAPGLTISSLKPCKPAVSLIKPNSELAKPFLVPDKKMDALTNSEATPVPKVTISASPSGSAPTLASAKKPEDSTAVNSAKCSEAVPSTAGSADFDPVTDLDWKDGIAALPGSNFKFCLNEFGVMEFVNELDSTTEKSASTSATKSVTASAEKSVAETAEKSTAGPADTKMGSAEESASPKPQVKTGRNRKQLLCQRDESIWKSEIESVEEAFTNAEEEEEELLDETGASDKETNDRDPTTMGNAYDVLRCLQCRHYGLALDFVKSGRFCSPACATEFCKTRRLVKLNKEPKEPAESKRKPLPESSSAENSNEAKKQGKPRGRPLGATKASKKLPKGFCWTSYLDEIKGIAAPAKLFKDAFPCYKNGFRVGMKLEGVDPGHPSMFCVLSVSEVCGFRIKLHFDGYSESFDFWANADSIDILPVGWCEKMGHRLHPPKGFTMQTFSWVSYLKLSKAQAAPKHLFTNKNYNAVSPHGFRVGMKLEAVDKKNSSLVCVATVTDVMDNRFLVHFDGWDDIYDYWADPTSPYIHPVGWCEENGHVLTPPNNYKNPTHFTWEAYLAGTKSQAAPVRAFKVRVASGFKPGMSLEAVDRRNPSLIRVASIVATANHEIKISFTNWDEAYDYWVDDDSPDIHPVGWCSKTGHPLQPPPTLEDLLTPSLTGCPTPGCKGFGHIKGPKYTSHHSSFGCPYSEMNASKEAALPDRLHGTKDLVSTEVKAVLVESPPVDLKTWKFMKMESEKYDDPGKPKKKCPTPGCNGVGHITGKFTQHRKASGCPILEKNKLNMKAMLNDANMPDLLQSGNRGHKKRRLSGDDQPSTKEMRMCSDTSDSCSSFAESSAKCSLSEGPSMKRELSANRISSDLFTGVHQSIFLPPASFGQNSSGDVKLSRHYQSKLLPCLQHHRGQDVLRWNSEKVAEFVHSVPGCQDVAKVFVDEQIDGEAFMLLTQGDIVKLMNIKLGPALKIYNSILMLHSSPEDS